MHKYKHLIFLFLIAAGAYVAYKKGLPAKLLSYISPKQIEA